MKRFHILAVFGTLLFVLIAGGTWVFAQSGDLIHACVNPAGQPRIVSSEAECKSQEYYLGWHIADPSGQDDAGLYRIVMETPKTSIRFHSSASFEVTCETGDFALGWFHSFSQPDNNDTLRDKVICSAWPNDSGNGYVIEICNTADWNTSLPAGKIGVTCREQGP